MEHYVAERYVASADGRHLRIELDRLRAAAIAVGRATFLQSVYLPDDDLCLYLFRSDSAETVAEVARLAALDVDRIRPAEVTGDGLDVQP